MLKDHDETPSRTHPSGTRHLDYRTVLNRDISLYTRVGYSHSQHHVTTGFEPSTQPPYTAADTMPTHGGPGRFDTVAGLLAATPPQLRLLDSSLPDDAERAAVRSCCAGTLASCIAQLDAAIAPHAVRMMDGRLPTSDAFRGDDHDLSLSLIHI